MRDATEHPGLAIRNVSNWVDWSQFATLNIYNHFAWFSLLIGRWPIYAGKQRESLMDNATKLSETSEMINTTHTV